MNQGLMLARGYLAAKAKRDARWTEGKVASDRRYSNTRWPAEQVGRALAMLAEGRSLGAIASVMGRSPIAVEIKLRRIERALRRGLARLAKAAQKYSEREGIQ
uniref:Uncharacterized protein n=1 Tax=viral metagenome TaxID=1070528 RepID=A0A6M3L4P0_9ZZZZ